MHIEARLFEFVAAFFVLTTVLYGVLTAMFATGGVSGPAPPRWRSQAAWPDRGHILPVCGPPSGCPARGLRGAEISDGAGELGFFAPHSWWPIVVALSGSVAAVGIALWLPWLIVAGVVFILGSAAGLVFEYYVGPEKHRPAPRRSQSGHQLVGSQFAVTSPPGPVG